MLNFFKSLSFNHSYFNCFVFTFKLIIACINLPHFFTLAKPTEYTEAHREQENVKLTFAKQIHLKLFRGVLELWKFDRTNNIWTSADVLKFKATLVF